MSLPAETNAAIQYLETRVPRWESGAAAIGLTAAQVTALKARVTAARAAYEEALAARAAAKAATVSLREAMSVMRIDAGGLIRTVRAFADTSNNPDVYALAQIDPPAPPTPARAPTQPTELRAVIEPTGALTIQWKATRPAPLGSNLDASTSGVVYTVKRKLRAEANFTIIGAVPATRGGSRAFSTFTDSTLPGGGAANGVQYVIQGQRATTTGQNLAGPESPVYTIMLGASEGAVPLVLSDGVSAPGGAVRIAA